MKGVTLAYLAGILDGEGHVGIHLEKRQGYHYAVARIAVGMTNEAAVRALARVFGGTAKKRPPGLRGRKPVFLWQVTNKLATKVAKTLLPYLVVKAPQAACIVALDHMKQEPRVKVQNWWARPEEYRQREKSLADAVKLFNRFGPYQW